MFVDKQCFKVPNTANNCFHYAKFKYDDDWVLYPNSYIDSDDEHFKNVNKDEWFSMAGFTIEERENIRAKCPKRDTLDFLPNIVGMDTKLVSYNEAKKGLIECIGSDCWGMYLRDKNNKPIKTVFNSRTKSTNQTDEGITDIRYKLYTYDDTIETYMNDAFKNNYTICILMGETDFIDFYYTPTDDNKFIETEIKYYRKS